MSGGNETRGGDRDRDRERTERGQRETEVKERLNWKSFVRQATQRPDHKD
jgi:hypothetical protein